MPHRFPPRPGAVLAGVLVLGLIAGMLVLIGVLRAGAPERGEGSRFRKIGYYNQWAGYDRQFLVKDLVTSGSASRLTTVNYAFASVGADSRCYEAVPSGERGQAGQADAWADYQRRFDAAQSVDGVADTYDQPLAGNFNQLKKLKAKYPHLSVQMSLGGWTGSKHLSDAALTDASRKAFVTSCLDLFIKGDLPRIGTEPQGGEGVAAGVFDGIDIDWEWPGSAGNDGNTVRPEDKRNFTLLLAEFRRQLDEAGEQNGRRYTLSAFLPADPAKMDAGFEAGPIFSVLDWATVQGYDFHGAFETTTNQQSALTLPASRPQQADLSAEGAIDSWIQRGAPASKLVLGVPFYGRGWTGVPDTGNGLFQQATGAAPGTYEPGFEDYKKLVPLTGAGYRMYRDGPSGFAWLFNGSTFWTFDDPQVMGQKAAYVKRAGLGGVMAWSLDGDDTQGSLVRAMTQGLD